MFCEVILGASVTVVVELMVDCDELGGFSNFQVKGSRMLFVSATGQSKWQQSYTVPCRFS